MTWLSLIVIVRRRLDSRSIAVCRLCRWRSLPSFQASSTVQKRRNQVAFVPHKIFGAEPSGRCMINRKLSWTYLILSVRKVATQETGESRRKQAAYPRRIQARGRPIGRYVFLHAGGARQHTPTIAMLETCERSHTICSNAERE